MTTMLLVLGSMLAAAPTDGFAEGNPGAVLVRSADGRRLVHASGFFTDTGARRPEDAARAFLAAHGAAFGVTARHALAVRGPPAPGRPGAVRFERTIDGLSVFGGDLVVGVDARSRVFLVNSGDVGSLVSGRHAIGDAAAEVAALSSFSAGVRPSGRASIARGWRPSGSVVRAVYRVDFMADEPPGDWRVFVDGETGAALFREDMRYRASAPGRVFEISPTETAAAACPTSSGGAHSLCASPVEVTLPNLVTGQDLVGTQTSVYDCNGGNAPTAAADVPGTCAAVAPVAAAFDFPVDVTYRSPADDFAAAMAYYQLDRHVSFLKKLDPTLPGGTGRAVRASLPALVNAYSGGLPFSNAYYSGGLDAMVFGQGSTADFAYDATVAYHELTHGAVSAWGGFNATIDALGGLAEPRAVNEGTADAMAASETGRSQIGSFVAAMLSTPRPYLRDLSDPTAARTCQGNGSLVTQLGATGVVNGLDGEVHDDGEIWNGFFWEVYQGLEAAGLRSCGGSCEGGPALQYAALQLAAGTSPTLGSYWQTLKSAATALFPAQPAAAGYVDCVARRRRLDGCDRTVPVYGAETKLQFIDQRFSPFQMTVQTTGATQVAFCSALGSTTTVYVRWNQPVQVDPVTGSATADLATPASIKCPSASSVNLPHAGTWYLLLDSPSAFPGNSPGYDIYLMQPSRTNVARRPPSAAPPICTPPLLTITTLPVEQPARVPPRGSLTFAATGGSGEGYAWSLSANPSGGSISDAAVYTAGPIGSGSAGAVADVVQVTDSLGNVATKPVQVTQGVAVYPPQTSAAPGGAVHFTAHGGSGSGFAWSLATNASGGTIDAGTGSYRAGSTADVTDVVQVTDSLGNAADASIRVAAPAPRSTGGSASGGCGTAGGSDASAMALALGLLLRKPRASRERRQAQARR